MALTHRSLGLQTYLQTCIELKLLPDSSFFLALKHEEDSSGIPALETLSSPISIPPPPPPKSPAAEPKESHASKYVELPLHSHQTSLGWDGSAGISLWSYSAWKVRWGFGAVQSSNFRGLSWEGSPSIWLWIRWSGNRGLSKLELCCSPDKSWEAECGLW